MHAMIRAALGTALLGAAAGAPASEGGHRQHGAHQHGHATLQVALDGEELVAELRVPAVNVVGFEHAPADEAQRRAVREALAHFGAAQRLLVPAAAAGCRLESHRVEMAGMDPDHGEEHGHGKKDGRDEKHGHDQEHARDEGHEHEREHAQREEHAHEKEHGHAQERARDERHEHEPEHAQREEHAHGKEHGHDEQHRHGEETHSELHAHYAWHCDAPDALDRLALRLFEQLEGLEAIEAQVVTPSLQTATELRPGATMLPLQP